MPTNLKPTKADIAFSITKALAGLLPATGMVATLVDEFIPSEVNKRRDSLLLKLERDFEELPERVKEVLEKPFFISIFMQSFRSAMATEKEEKIDAYRAIILNTAIEENPDEDEIEVMVKITDSLTPLHIKLIKIFEDPPRYLAENPEAKERFGSPSMGGIGQLIRACLPNYPQDLVNVAIRDINNSGIGNGMDNAATMTESGMLACRITDFGKRYIKLITLPVKN